MAPLSVISRFVRSVGGAACVAIALVAMPAHATPDPMADTLAKLDIDLRALREDAAKAPPQNESTALSLFRIDAEAIGRAVDLVPTLRSLSAALRRQDGGANPNALADNADRISAAVEAARGKAQLRSESYGGADDPRYRQLVAQWGESFANAVTWAPTAAWDVFRPTVRPSDKALDVALIWDEQEAEWYRIDGAVPVEAIFHDGSVGLGRRLTPGKLKYLAENIGQVKAQKAAADAFSTYLSDAAQNARTPQGQAFARLSNGDQVLSAARESASFAPRYVYDAIFRATVLTSLDHLRQDLLKQGADAEASLRDLDALLRQNDITLDSQWGEGVIPANATVRVTAWFADNPKNKFVSTWRFEKEKVTVEIDKGYGHGIRTGNMVKSDGSIPGRNCTASDEREFKDGGALTFTAIYVCTLDDGSTQVSNVEGAGSWQIVSPLAAPAAPAAAAPRASGRNGSKSR